MLDLIRKARARLKAFSHTVDEVRGILFAHASNLSRSAPSTVTARLSTTSCHKTDLLGCSTDGGTARSNLAQIGASGG